MRFSHSFVLFTLLAAPLCALATSDVSIADIKNAAAEDNIDLSAFPDLDVALESIEATYASHAARKRDPTTAKCRQRDISSASTIIDVHSSSLQRHIYAKKLTGNNFFPTAHVVPDWYKVLVPTTGGNPTPQWNVSSYLAFMDTQGISHSIFAFSAPGSNVYFGQREITVALARLINEQSAAYARLYPRRFSFYAVVPLPYTAEAIKEANYALDKLGAAGVVLTSNHEGMYLGHASFRPFFEAMNKRGKTILYVHPAAPYMKVDNKFVEANPTPYPTGNIEF
jgi:6-methylsalicylate decarboxylase